MDAVLGAVGSAVGEGVGSAFGLSPDLIKGLGGVGGKNGSGDMLKSLMSGDEKQLGSATAKPHPVDLSQLLAVLKNRANLGT